MCSICGGSGYMPAVRYGVGYGTGSGAIIWDDHAVVEPCTCRRWQWSPVAPHWPQPIYIPMKDTDR